MTKHTDNWYDVNFSSLVTPQVDILATPSAINDEESVSVVLSVLFTMKIFE